MRRLILLVLLLNVFAFGQGSGYNAYQTNTFTTTGPFTPAFENGLVKYHQLIWTTSGTVSTCTVALDTSADGINFTAGGAIAGQTCTTNGSSSITGIVTANYVRINLTALSGGGSVTIVYEGWAYNPSGGGGGSTCGTPTCTVSSAGSGNGVLALSGNTSGTATLTAPAVAGTAANAVLFSNAISWPTGLGAINNVAGATDSNLVLFASSGRTINIEVNSTGSELTLDNASGGRFYPATNNSIVNGISGGFSWKSTSSIAYLTDTNCAAVGTAANPSVASCTAAAAGSFSCATNASTGTCTVNTTAVTANSEIFITQRTDTTTGTRLAVTCNTTVSTVIPVITAVTAGTSFTINLGTITTNPECFSYSIVN